MNEEDIKNLSEIIELCEEEINNNDENVTAILDLTDLKSLRNLINRNQEIEEDYTSVYLKGVYEERDKWKSKIKEKIEELSEDLEIMKVDAMYGRYKEYGSKLSFEKQFIYKYGMHDVLQELLEKRK